MTDEKPYKGLIRDWKVFERANTDGDQVEFIVGITTKFRDDNDAFGHPESIVTSAVVSIDAKGNLETQNSRYKLVGPEST